jgi:hypothetical protein
MANYIFIVSKREKAERLAGLFPEGESRALRERNAGGSETLYLQASQVSDGPEQRGLLPPALRNLIPRREAGFFLGYAIDHENGTVCFDNCPPQMRPDPRKPLEGCYLRISVRRWGYTIGNDVFSQLPMLHFSSDGIVAVSDSLFALTEIRKQLNLPCRLNKQVLSGRLWTNAMADQLLGHDTPIEGISLAPLCATLTIDARDVSLICEAGSVREKFETGVSSYAGTINEGALRAARLVETFSSLASTSLSLSGGLDSRVCLAAAALTRKKNEIHIGSTPSRIADYEVASMLSERFGFALNRSALNQPAPTRIDIDRLSYWAAFCAGIYDPLYAPPAISQGAPRFPITGHGAEMMKGNYGWRPLHAVMRGPELNQARVQSQAALSRMGIDPSHKWGSEWHYLGLRNAIHSGRSTMGSIIGARLLSQRKLVALSRSDLNVFPAPRKGAPSIVSDLLISLSPELALAPFDDEKKNMGKEYVSSRLAALGGGVRGSEVRSYKVYGTPRQAAGGIPCVVRMAGERGFSGGIKTKRIRPLCEAAIELAPSSMADHYQSMLRSFAELTDPISASSRPAAAAGKILTLLLSD